MNKTAVTILIVLSSISVCFLLFLGFLAFILTSGDDEVPKDKIFAYVSANYEKLDAFPSDEYQQIMESYKRREFSQDELKKRETEFIKKHLSNDTIVKDIHNRSDNLLEFYCGGSGMLDHSTYVGFWYSKDVTPFTEGGDLTETSPDVFEWRNEDGRRGIYIEKIRDHWYYYKEDL